MVRVCSPPCLFSPPRIRRSPLGPGQGAGVSGVPAADLRPAQHGPERPGFTDPGGEQPTVRPFLHTSAAAKPRSHLCASSPPDSQPGPRPLGASSDCGALGAPLELCASEQLGGRASLQLPHQQQPGSLRGPH